MSDREATIFKWARFVVGVVLIILMLGVHAFIKELSVAWIALPGVLLGISPEKVLAKWLK